MKIQTARCDNCGTPLRQVIVTETNEPADPVWLHVWKAGAYERFYRYCGEREQHAVAIPDPGSIR